MIAASELLADETALKGSCREWKAAVGPGARGRAEGVGSQLR